VIGSGFVGGIFGQASSASGFGIQGVGFQGVVGVNTTDSNSDALVATGLGGNLIRANNSHNVNVMILSDDGTLNALRVFGLHGVLGFCEVGCGANSAGVDGVTNISGMAGVRGSALTDSSAAVEGIGTTGVRPGDIFLGTDGTSTVFRADTIGDVFISGMIFTGGSCVNGCSRTKKIRTYVAHESAPISEDTGEAQLVNGHAYVSISSDFANVIDQRTTYLVFITPEGNSRGLYVSDKSHSGFAVHENEGGHSTLAFSYRIVAKPYGENETRLPMVDLKSEPRPTFVKPHTPTRSAPKTPVLLKP
jgi:hypothetical protein